MKAHRLAAAVVATCLGLGPAITPAAGAEVSIEHEKVTCVVAGRHPKLDACFRPAERVGRAQVQFRGRGDEPWYFVEMSGPAECLSALLPKPTRALERFQYFVHVVDRGFATSQFPEAAPDQPFAPRVVEREGECQDDLVGAWLPRAERRVVVGVARDAAGRPVSDEVAASLESSLRASGFSLDDVTLAGALPARPATSRKGLSRKTWLIAGGAAAAVLLAVVVASGGDGYSPPPPPVPPPREGFR
jgi:hypothetical protein